MKKTTIIFSFLLISIFSIGSYALYMAYLENYKQDFREHIREHKNETDLTIIDINSSELYVNSASISWEDDNQEIVYKGTLYDIVDIKNKGSKVSIIVVSDEQEMTLKKEFADMYDVKSNSHTKKPFELLKNFLALKCIVNHTGIDFSNNCFNNILLNTHKAFYVTPVFTHLDTPPPDCFI